MPSIHPPSLLSRAVLRCAVLRYGVTACCVVLCGFIAGCGADKYEQRLRESKRFYSELETIEINLAPKWSDGRVVDVIRVPKQFQPIPAPQPIKGDTLTVVPDFGRMRFIH